VITIRNVQIKSGRGGQFLAFPQRKGSGGKFFNYVKVERADGDYLLNQVKNEETAASPTGFEITGVKVKPIESTGRTKAFVEFELNGVLTLYSWSIIEGDRGPFLGSPRDKVGDEWKDLVFATREFREQLQTAALAEYGRAGGTAPQPTSTRTPAATDDDEEEDDE
jgi:DNA-binding cell septation regulator SpoVG